MRAKRAWILVVFLLILSFQNCTGGLERFSSHGVSQPLIATHDVSPQPTVELPPQRDPGPADSKEDAPAAEVVPAKKTPGPFRVMSGQVYGPDSQRFIVKGVTMFDYIFSYGGPASEAGYSGPFDRYLEAAQKLGLNFVRVGIDYKVMNNEAAFRSLDKVIRLAGARGMVVQIQNQFDPHFNSASVEQLSLVRTLGTRYAAPEFSNVWINPGNELNCAAGEAICYDPARWKADITLLIGELRAGGFKNPIVINGIGYGFVLVGGCWNSTFNQSAGTCAPSPVKSIVDFIPTDSNLVVGVHKYPSADDTVTASLELQQWSSLVGTYAMIVDEMGLGPGTVPDLSGHLGWAEKMIAYIGDWVIRGGGVGLVAFTWYDNYCPAGSLQNCVTDQNLTPTAWGKLYKDKYVDRF